MNGDPFLKRVVYISLVMVFLLVSGVLFGPWEIDPNASILIALVAQPGGVALGCLLKQASSS